MGAVITVAITLIAGAALFGYVNAEASRSENNLGVANAANVNFLNEKFVVVDMAVPPLGSPGCTTSTCSANIWIYNNGHLTLSIEQIVLYDRTKSFHVTFDGSPSGGNCAGNGQATYYPAGSPAPFLFGGGGTEIVNGTSPVQITLTLSSPCTFAPGTTYYANVLGVYGNVMVYPECDTYSGCTS
jgi:hypothetical protein